MSPRLQAMCDDCTRRLIFLQGFLVPSKFIYSSRLPTAYVTSPELICLKCAFKRKGVFVMLFPWYKVRAVVWWICKS